MIRCDTCEHRDSKMCTHPGIGERLFKQKGLNPLCLVRIREFQPVWCPLGEHQCGGPAEACMIPGCPECGAPVPRSKQLNAEQSETFLEHAFAPSPFIGEERVLPIKGAEEPAMCDLEALGERLGRRVVEEDRDQAMRDAVALANSIDAFESRGFVYSELTERIRRYRQKLELIPAPDPAKLELVLLPAADVTIMTLQGATATLTRKQLRHLAADVARNLEFHMKAKRDSGDCDHDFDLMTRSCRDCGALRSDVMVVNPIVLDENGEPPCSCCRLNRAAHPTDDCPAYSACRSGKDGECNWEHCPQIRDGEPEGSGRHCPLDNRAAHS